MPATNKLLSVHPDLVSRVHRILAAMTALGFPMVVTDGVRTDAQQAALFAQGRTAPGRIVTQVNGVTSRSKHQPHTDGFGRAVDCAFLVRGVPSWDESLPWEVYGAAARALGLLWGGGWLSFPDKPHIELPPPTLHV